MSTKKDQDFQKFLDTQQYARKGILLYERIFGTTYISTGGEQTTRDFCTALAPAGLKVRANSWWKIDVSKNNTSKIDTVSVLNVSKMTRLF